MGTFEREVPGSQVAITIRELEQAGATDIRCVPAENGTVRVAAKLPTSIWRRPFITHGWSGESISEGWLRSILRRLLS